MDLWAPVNGPPLYKFLPENQGSPLRRTSRPCRGPSPRPRPPLFPALCAAPHSAGFTCLGSSSFFVPRRTGTPRGGWAVGPPRALTGERGAAGPSPVLSPGAVTLVPRGRRFGPRRDSASQSDWAPGEPGWPQESTLGHSPGQRAPSPEPSHVGPGLASRPRPPPPLRFSLEAGRSPRRGLRVIPGAQASCAVPSWSCPAVVTLCHSRRGQASGAGSAPVPRSQDFASTQTIPGRPGPGRASWESAPGLFPGSSGRRSRETEWPSGGRGSGEDQALPLGLGDQGTSHCGQGPRFSAGLGTAGWPCPSQLQADPGSSPCSRPAGRCWIPWKPEEPEPPRRPATSWDRSSRPALGDGQCRHHLCHPRPRPGAPGLHPTPVRASDRHLEAEGQASPRTAR
ncbi:collagen alpha-1(III) chain-like isoform X5 [Canis lupus familiaris]|uniref:collagen alpha-1(III) chain-like isoform X5 n=1 Tax=Canis lupus familiaris TaxID=9615 RepID=UPI0018F37F66|nr:collagen alpha-1(III) chain-like isoform X5 [Canis lupus familiaris]